MDFSMKIPFFAFFSDYARFSRESAVFINEGDTFESLNLAFVAFSSEVSYTIVGSIP